MNDICSEKHRRIDEKMEVHDKRLNDHARQLDELSISNARNSTQIDNLCGKIDDLVTIIKWFIGLMVGAFIGFFFYAVQNNLFN